MRYLKILFLINLFFFFCAFAFKVGNYDSFSPLFFSNDSKSALIEDKVVLDDNDEFYLNSYFNSNRYNYPLLKIEFSDVPLKPLIIKSFEKHQSDFGVLMDYFYSNFITNNDLFFRDYNRQFRVQGEYSYLFSNYQRIHNEIEPSPFEQNEIDKYQKIRHYHGDDPDNFNLSRWNGEDIELISKTYSNKNRIWPIDFFHKIISEKIGRETLFNYAVEFYKKYSKDIPVSSKNKIIELFEKMKLFIDVEIDKINDINVSNLPYYKSFLYRRYRVDNISKVELKSLIDNFIQIVRFSITQSDKKNVLNININSDLTILDNSKNQFSVVSISSKKQLFFDINKDIFIKCIKDGGQNFYVFEEYISNGNKFLGFYNSKLDKIR